jgi:hypothetical protein
VFGFGAGIFVLRCFLLEVALPSGGRTLLSWRALLNLDFAEIVPSVRLASLNRQLNRGLSGSRVE